MNPLTGEGAPPEATGFTRGLIAAALTGLVDAAILFSPMDAELAKGLVVALTPTLTVVSYFAFALMDRGLGKLNPPTLP